VFLNGAAVRYAVSGHDAANMEEIMPNDITLEQVRRMAADAGLTHYTEEHLQQLLRATKIAQSRRAALPTRDLTPADEPSHVYRLDR
jgi:hypothetical protein